jgi:hypothetical protein
MRWGQKTVTCLIKKGFIKYREVKGESYIKPTPIGWAIAHRVMERANRTSAKSWEKVVVEQGEKE